MKIDFEKKNYFFYYTHAPSDGGLFFFAGGVVAISDGTGLSDGDSPGGGVKSFLYGISRGRGPIAVENIQILFSSLQQHRQVR